MQTQGQPGHCVLCLCRWQIHSPEVNPTEITSSQPRSKQGRTGLQSVHGRLGYGTASPAHAKVSGEGAGSTVGSGLGREHLMKTLTHLVVINPGGNETAKQRPYDKDWEHVVPPDPGCNSTH